MDQNSNDNLFNFGDQQPRQPEQPQQPLQPPQPPQQPVQPYNTNDQPTVLSSGPAQVYNTPPSYQPVEPPPPPPPPVYTPPPAYVGEQPPKKSNRTIWIIAIVVILLLCCCCLIGAIVWLYNNGDQFINDYSFILPIVQSFLA